jgi:hypothetical protein
MSTVGYAQRRGLREVEAKERRKKFLALGGVGLLALVLVIQVPKTLDMLKSDSSSGATPSVVVTPAATPRPAAEAPRPRPRFLSTARVDDPFAGSRAGAGESPPGAVGAPAGLRDPFQLRSATPAPPPVRVPRRIVVGTPGTRAPRIGYTVVLASIPTSNSRAQAVRFARTARARGVSGVGVLRSSARNRLRSGYWVVYSGMFRNSAGAQRAAAQVHARGYRTAYLRQLVRY